MADRGADDDPQADFGDTRCGGVERITRIQRAGNPDDRDGIAGQHETVGGEVPCILRAERAEADPQRECAEKKHALLRKEADEEQRDGCTDQRSDEAVEALGQYKSALRLRYDENREERPLRLIEIEGERYQQGNQPRCSRLRGKDHRGATLQLAVFAVKSPLTTTVIRRRISSGAFASATIP